MILNFDFALKLSNYTSLRFFLGLKWILKNVSTILQSQFNNHTLPDTPFNVRCLMVIVSSITLLEFRNNNRTQQRDVVNSGVNFWSFKRFSIRFHTDLSTRQTHKGLKGTVVNLALHSINRESLEITLTVPLKITIAYVLQFM